MQSVRFRFIPTFGVILLGFVILIVHNVAISPWMLDDSFISFRYAENLVNGHGLVFNSGERVEGYTSFLWVLLLGLGNFCGVDTVHFSQILGGLFGALSIVLLCFSHELIEGVSANQSAVAGLLLGSCGIFTPWARSGMEVSFFTFLVLLTVILYLRLRDRPSGRSDLINLSFVGALTALARPEGIIIFAMIWIDFAVRGGKGRLQQLAILAVPFAVLVAAHFLWRFSYYGYWLPNTFYDKVGATVPQVLRGINYVGRFSLAAANLLVIPVITFAFVRKITQQPVVILLSGIVVSYLIYIILVGGDVMPAYRFCTPLIPLLCLITALCLDRLTKSRMVVYIVVPLLFGFNIAQLFIDDQIHNHIAVDHVAENGQEVGMFLKANFPPETVIATNSAGCIPYYSGFKTIDMLGLNDEHIAHSDVPNFGEGRPGHEKGDGNYVLSRSPDIIQFGGAGGARMPIFLGDKQIYDNPLFQQSYRFVHLRLPSGRPLALYIKNSFFKSEDGTR